MFVQSSIHKIHARMGYVASPSQFFVQNPIGSRISWINMDKLPRALQSTIQAHRDVFVHVLFVALERKKETT